VAGAFLALVALATSIAKRGSGARAYAWMCVLALAPIALLALAFGEGGYEPFAPSAFWPALAGVLLIGAGAWRALGPARDRLLVGTAVGATAYALALIGSFAVHTPLGGNTARLGALLAGPLVAGIAWEHRRALVAWLAPVLLYWQLAAPVHDLAAISSDPSVHASYFAPLKAELEALAHGRPMRVEVPMMGSHWEAAYVPAGSIVLARGWERQLDTRYGALFYRPALSRRAYRTWLADNGVSYVALPDGRIDKAGRLEGALVRAGAPYLRPVWRSAHWRLYAVVQATPLAQRPAVLSAWGGQSFALQAPAAGAYAVKVRFSPFWKVASGGGCVEAAAGGWTRVRARRAATMRISISFSLERILAQGPRC
jgi:hypothetical protein